MRRLVVPILIGLLCAPLAGCGADRPRTPPITVPDTPPAQSTASSTPTASASGSPSTGPTTPAPPTIPAITPTPTAAPPPPLRNTGLADVSSPRPALGHLNGVRLARQENYDRLVFEFADQVPGYTVGYRPLPATADGSGAPIPLPGATDMVLITLTPARAHRDENGTPTYTGPPTVKGNSVKVTEAKAAGDFEGHVTWVAGLRSKVPFRVLVLSGPPRLVVDFAY
jgi:hypothetical protein